MWSAVVSLVLGLLSLFLGKKADNAEKAGEMKQANADLNAAAKEISDARKIENDVAAASDSELDEQLRKWTRSGGNP
jgi:hypothetical protein